MQFIDRKDAGKRLARELLAYRGRRDAIVLALPRGGVPVAAEVAKALDLPLDLMLVRKLGVPGHEELAMGAIANGDVQVLNKDIVEALGVSEAAIEQVVEEEHEELLRRNKAYRGGRAAPELKGKTVILVDDGMATGANMRAAVLAVRKQHAAHTIVAVPVASGSAHAFLGLVADEVISLQTPEPFYGVGQWYRDFAQTGDAEVQALLKQPSGKIMALSCMAGLLCLLLLGACSDLCSFKPYDYKNNEDAAIKKEKSPYSMGLKGRRLYLKRELGVQQ